MTATLPNRDLHPVGIANVQAIVVVYDVELTGSWPAAAPLRHLGSFDYSKRQGPVPW